MKISVIIPTLNEAACIGRLIDFLQRHGAGQLLEIIVVDAGSEDGTAAIAASGGALVLRACTRSRAAQMNQGAQKARGEILYFVHADTMPPANFALAIQRVLAQGLSMGCFRYRFDSPKRLLKLNAWFTRLDYLWCQGGDKTFFILASTFACLGGYDERFVVMEEYEFIRKARKQYSFRTLPETATASARKYEKNSWLRVQLANLIVFNLYRLGMAPPRLRLIYRSLLRW